MAPILGALFAVLIGIVAIRPYLDYQQRSFENIRVANTAAQFRQVLNAAQSYIQSNYSSIVSDFGNAPTYQLPYNDLVSYFPAGSSPTNPYGQSWNISVRQTSGGGVEALVYSSGGSTIPERLAPEIAAETGQEGGFMPAARQYGQNTPDNTAMGAYGHWTVSLSDYGLATGDNYALAGHLAGLLYFGANGSGGGAGSGYNNDYLYRVSVPGHPNLNTMSTGLNMGNNNITDAGSVQTQNQTATNTTTMESNNQQASATISAAGSDSGDNTVDMVANSTQASLTLQNGTGSPLTLISAPQIVGTACNNKQIGTIAPNADDSGRPLVCMTQQGAIEAISVSNQLDQQGFYDITASWTNTTDDAQKNAAWELMGSDSSFLQTEDVTNFHQGAGYFYKNDTSRPIFISSNCNPATIGILAGLLSASIMITLQGPYSDGSNAYSTSSSQVSVAGLSLLQIFSAAPGSSAIVPAGYSFNYTTEDVGDCPFMVTY